MCSFHWFWHTSMAQLASSVRFSSLTVQPSGLALHLNFDPLTRLHTHIRITYWKDHMSKFAWQKVPQQQVVSCNILHTVDVLFSNGVGSKCNHSKFTTVGSQSWRHLLLSHTQTTGREVWAYCNVQACNRIKQILVLSGWIKIFSSLKTWDKKTAAPHSPLTVQIKPPHWFPFDRSRTIKTKAELINTKRQLTAVASDVRNQCTVFTVDILFFLSNHFPI